MTNEESQVPQNISHKYRSNQQYAWNDHQHYLQYGHHFVKCKSIHRVDRELIK